MYRISELAEKVGLSRSTLLYYEKLGLISAKRQANGYRSYSEQDLQRLKLLQQLQAGGLTLKECQSCLESRIDRELLLQRLKVLDDEIAQKQQARELLSAMLGMSSMREWHQTTEKQAPHAHLDWLMKQGFDEKQALRLKWLSKDMNEHELYMADFELIFDGLERLGPGTEADSLTALKAVLSSTESLKAEPFNSGELLEIGCGRGIATRVLAQHSVFTITALDNDESSLNSLNKSLDKALKQRVNTVCASMTELPFEPCQFDVIWCEGGAYIMGVEQALKDWKPYIKAQGYLVLSDLVWSSDTPSDELREFWLQEYPDMVSAKQRIEQAKQAGYELIDSFPLSEQAWSDYYAPLKGRVDELETMMPNSKALADVKRELEIFHKRQGKFDYQMLILKKM
ncbi:MerR family transcriptional regulator [Shewanella schlegeliana]|uniref:MerR family transcriptional regulator n=1 Tax=Shewanella schlegeliana TaxID=190308 RepID=A0ABS1SXG7_9GAMM|nr:MerR family transcriptional regulator [Shewanella schlegeliana]MBL4912272.1 MerR family transcriptional regulator [Shewanella schlegeliana]MCL1108259.1 MerR family transcriptional regulator [Shewanella schlegeliana]GIU22384.1 methyltransferase [Shewanella schlegeliana]